MKQTFKITKHRGWNIQAFTQHLDDGSKIVTAIVKKRMYPNPYHPSFWKEMGLEDLAK